PRAAFEPRTLRAVAGGRPGRGSEIDPTTSAIATARRRVACDRKPARTELCSSIGRNAIQPSSAKLDNPSESGRESRESRLDSAAGFHRIGDGRRLPDAPLDESAQHVEGGRDGEPEVAQFTLGDRIANPLERVEEHGVVVPRSATRARSPARPRRPRGPTAPAAAARGSWAGTGAARARPRRPAGGGLVGRARGGGPAGVDGGPTRGPGLWGGRGQREARAPRAGGPGGR